MVDEQGDVLFGLGRLKILEAIQRCGSIHAASKELKMSYRAVWGRIKATEERLGKQLLVRNIGGPAGGGSQLTEYAETLMKEFFRMHKEVIADTDRSFEEILLPAIVETPSKKAGNS